MSGEARVGVVGEVAPGSVVVVRDEEWLVTQVGRTRDGVLVTCQGLSELVQGSSAQFSEALDLIEAVDPAKARVVADTSPGYRRSRLWLDATVRKLPVPADDPALTVVDGMLMDPLDYQRSAVRKALDPATLRPRILLADAVGLGKTLEIGMILSELVRRGRGERILVVTPRHVLEQMQHELWTRFALPFVRLDSVGIQRVRRKLPATRNPFSVYKRAIISIDTLKSDRYLAHLRKHRWDAIVIDESHNITNRSTKNNRLASILAETTDALILASATPHNGKKESFAELVRLLEPTAVRPDGDPDRGDLERLVIRRHRHSPEVSGIVGGDWAERRPPNNRLVDASPAEDAVAQLLADRWLYADRSVSGDALFGWTLAKAFLSSPAALVETCRNRLSKVSDPVEREALTELAERAAAAEDGAGKYATLLEEMARVGVGPRSGARVVVFAERVATLRWLAERLRRDLRLGGDQVEVLHGGLDDQKQQAIVESFKQESSPIRVLVTGDVASEGVNLHLQCHELVHYDIPWSLIRIEQRNGRINRYGQKHPPQITTLLLQPSDDRFSGDLRVLTSLMEKEHEAHVALGDSASLMGEYSVEAEEAAIREVLRGRRALDDVVATPDQVLGGGSLEGLLAQLAALEAQPPAAATPDSSSEPTVSGSGLYAAPVDFLREAVGVISERPHDPPERGGLGWREHDGHRIVELVPPRDLRDRLAVLPQSYLADREVLSSLKLATSPAEGAAQLRAALADEHGSSWPVAHFLGPLHPVLDWASDRVLSSLGRGEIFAVRGTAQTTSVLVYGSLTNRAGRTVAASWVQVEFPEHGSTFSMPTPHASAAEMFAAAGVGEGMTNRADVVVDDWVRSLVGLAVDKAAGLLGSQFFMARQSAEERVHAWSTRATAWEHEADALVQRSDVRVRRQSVEEERRLAEQRMPDKTYVRPLLVVLHATPEGV